MTKAACLSRKERHALKGSEIARKGKRYVLRINQNSRPGCLLHDRNLDQFYSKYETRILLADVLDINIGSVLTDCAQHLLGDEIAFIIGRLPERFDHKKIRLGLGVLAARANALNSLISRVSLKRPSLVFS